MSKNLLHFDLDYDEMDFDDEDDGVRKMRNGIDSDRKRFKKRGLREDRKKKAKSKSEWMDED